MKFIGIISTFSVLIYIASALVVHTIESFFTLSSIVKESIHIIFWVAPLLLIGSMLLVQRKNKPYLKIPYVIGATWTVVLTYLFIDSFIIAFARILSLSDHSVTLLAYHLFTLSFILVFFGIWHARTIKTTSYTIKTENNQLHGRKIVVVSDLHLGIVRAQSFCKRVVEHINQTKPDAVLIVGDVIDGPLFEMKSSLNELSKLNAPHGVYAIPGNHEYYSFEQSLYFEEIQKYTHMLRNSKTELFGMSLIGLDHVDQESVEHFNSRIEPLEIDFTHSLILLHDPKHAKTLQSKGTFLSLSGHTHKGQFWPFSLVVRALYKRYTYGLVQKEKSTHITTSGVGTALSPVRIGSRAEIVVIELV